jgi:pyruvate/2-oxoglutarate dehydrogenase complex dihydrolipoamide acyltransferase (E2) component
MSPSARHWIDKNRLSVQQIKGTGRRGMIMKEDVLRFLSEPHPRVDAQASQPFGSHNLEKPKMSFAFPSNSKASIPHIYLSSGK